MPLWAVNTSGKGFVIVNAPNAKMARDFATGEFGGFGAGLGTETRLATQADVDKFPLLGTLLRGVELPASQADPSFISGFGFKTPTVSGQEPTAGGTTNERRDTGPSTTFTPPPTGGATKGNAAPEPLVWVQSPNTTWGGRGGTITRKQVPLSQAEALFKQGWSKEDGPFTQGILDSFAADKVAVNIDSGGGETRLSGSFLTAQPPTQPGGGQPGPDVGGLFGGTQPPPGGTTQPGGGQPGTGASFPPDQVSDFLSQFGGGAFGGGTGAGSSGFIPGGGGGIPGGGMAFPGGEIPETERAAQFLRGMFGQGVDPNTIAGRAATSQDRFNQFLNTFLLGSELQGFDPNQLSATDFEKFAREQTIGSVRQNAADIVRSIFGAGGPETGLRASLGQATPERAEGLGDLITTALGSRFAPETLRLLNLPSGAALRARFLAETGGEGNFLDFVRSNFPAFAALGA